MIPLHFISFFILFHPVFRSYKPFINHIKQDHKKTGQFLVGSGGEIKIVHLAYGFFVKCCQQSVKIGFMSPDRIILLTPSHLTFLPDRGPQTSGGWEGVDFTYFILSRWGKRPEMSYIDFILSFPKAATLQ